MTARSEIVSVSADDEIQKILQQADSGTFVIFDYNGVIVTSNDDFQKNKNMLKDLVGYFEQTLGKSKSDELLANVKKQSDWKLLNPDWPEIISQLQSIGAKTLLLTACRTGKIGEIYAEDLRIKEVKDFGIDFSKSWKNFPTTQFTNFSISSGDGYPLFKSGILFSSFIDKGSVLKEFLKYFQLKPKKIIFIDDALKNVLSVQKVCSELDISYIGIEYTKAHDKN